jgi:hypothetical protein
MLVYNGSPETLYPKAEGSVITIPPGDVIEIENAFHASLILAQCEMKGLVRVSAKDLTGGQPPDAVKTASRKAFVDFIEKQLNTFNNLQIAQNKQGLPGIVPTGDLKRYQALYKEMAGEEVHFEDSKVDPKTAASQLTAAFTSLINQLQAAQGDHGVQAPGELMDLGGSTPSGPGRTKSQENARQAKAKSTPKAQVGPK